MSALNKKSVKDIDVSGKRVLVRCDFNVPLQDGKITSDKRIVASLPTIKYLIDHHAKVILCSHLGRPKGEFKPEFSLAPVAARLSELLGQDVKMAKDVIGDSAKELAANLKDGEVMLLENVRFHAEETKNDPAFSKALASLADIYVNDAFGSAHRAHSSTTGVADYLPAVCGFLIQKEIEFMGGALENPKRPLVAILGGAKVSDKIGVINNLLDKVDTLIVGGGMAYTFFVAKGYHVGTSLFEADKVELAKEMMQKAVDKGVKFLLPIDNVISNEFAEDAEYKTINSDEFPDGWMGMDIGPKTRELFAEASHDGQPLIRGLFYEFPGEEAAADIADEYLFGPDILVAPVTELGARSREVYLPGGEATTWTNLHDGAVYAGGQTVTVEAPLDVVPAFARNGKDHGLQGLI